MTSKKWQVFIVLAILVLGAKIADGKSYQIATIGENSVKFGEIWGVGYGVIHFEPTIQNTQIQAKIDKLTDKLFILQLISHYSGKYGADTALVARVAECESGFNINAKSKTSSATGIFQFIKSTWRDYCEGTREDSEDNVKCAVRMISEGKINHWNASAKCWSDYFIAKK